MISDSKSRKTTSQLLNMIKGASTFEEATAYHQEAADPQFKDYLYELMTRKNLTPKEVIQACGMERSYFYHILNGVKRPGRNVILRMGFCMHATLQEMNQMLRLGGFSELYSRKRRDAALIFAITKKYTMEQANDLLIQAGEEALYRDERTGENRS